VVAVRLADDERARVPFALAGVVLLVASASAAVVLSTHDPAPDRTRADAALRDVETSVDVALVGAARGALRRAAEKPVVSPADSRYGAALAPDRAFRDALALRAYTRLEQSLRAVESRAGRATASASLPRVQTTADARRAIDATRFERVTDSVVRVTVSGVETTVRRDGSVVERRERNATMRVHSPVLALHDRVQRFEGRLSRGAFDGPGLDRRITDLLHRVVWLRGPLQYGGAPIANVLANRHVELAANRALLDQQRAAFGTADAEGSDAYDRAFARVGITDVTAAVRESAKSRATAVLTDSGVPDSVASVGFGEAADAVTDAARTVEIGVNATADSAFVAYADGANGTDIAATVRDAFAAQATRSVSVVPTAATRTRNASVPANWTLVDTETTTAVDVQRASADDITVPGRRVGAWTRRVTRTTTTVRVFRGDGERRSVAVTDRERYRVSVAVGYELAGAASGSMATDAVLDAPVDRVPAGVRERIAAGATERLIEAPGGVDALAVRAVTEEVDRETTATVRPATPDAALAAARRAAARQRARLRNHSVSVSVSELADGRVPVAELAAAVRGRFQPRARYETATDRAVAAVRAELAARVADRLGSRESGDALADAGRELGDRGVERPPESRPTVADTGPVAAVDGSPAYLTLGAVEPADVPSVEARYHPLAAKNTNWFTVPSGDVADTVLSAVSGAGSGNVGIGRAAQALRASQRAAAVNDSAAVHSGLRAAMRRAVGGAAGRYRSVLAKSRLPLSETVRQRAVRAALGEWETPAGRALALANGSAWRGVVAEAGRRADLTEWERDRLASRLRAATPDILAADDARVAADLVESAGATVRAVARTAVKQTVEDGVDRAVRRSARLKRLRVGGLPAGLPLLPPFGWYATANVWSVSARGSWATFSVRAASGSPLDDGRGTAYVREDEPVVFDVNGDGRPDAVGRNKRISFRVDATVAVVVPPGPRGVGDVDGNADERSPGW
jgi:hypothetical protein